ncbi:MAG: FtsX-like permease family protein [Hyphomicrobium sp.]
MTVATPVEVRSARTAPLPLVFRLAARELRSGLSGFYVFIACVALGVMVITGVGALSDALKSGFEKQGALLLGGDVTVSRPHTRATVDERRWIDGFGRSSETATMRTMGRTINGEDQTLIELKAVDAAYPLVGAVTLETGEALDAALARGVVADPMLLERLSLKAGDRLRIGEAEFDIAAVLKTEPDGLADRVAYGPRVILTHAQMEKTGLVQPGALIRWKYAVIFNESSEAIEPRLLSFRERVKKELPESGFTVTDRRDPSPQVTKTLERLRQFLTLLGLTALVTGGVGVANAVATFIDRRRKVIATMKSVGATGGTVFAVFLVQVMAMALAGVAIGLGLGLFIPPILTHLLGSYLPVVPEFALSAHSVALAVAYGLLVALLFALWPLGRAEQVRASVLFRDEVDPSDAWPAPRILALIVASAVALVTIAVLSSDSRLIAFYFVGGLALVILLFWGLGGLVTRFARRMKRPRRPELALAIANIGAPGGLTRSVVLSLGAGLSLLVAVALADSSLVNELESRLPATSPAYFVIDITKKDQQAFRETVLREVPGAEIEDAPMLRGRMVAIKGVPVEEIKAPPEAQWVLSGDRGLTYSDRVPAGSTVVEGEWWKPAYAGEPLVSFEAELARNLNLKIGDSITVNVLGRNLTAKVANLREVKWESLALNFVMVFSPNTLAGAPHNLLATISLPESAGTVEEVRLARALGKAFPAVTAIRVKEAIEAFNKVFEKVMAAVRVAGSVTLLAGALVLAGAMATAQRRRILEAVILRALGATRARILGAHVAEYLLLAVVTALAATVLGSIAAYAVVTGLMDLPFAFSWGAVGGALLTAAALVLTFGALGTWRVLSARPVPYLRSQ